MKREISETEKHDLTKAARTWREAAFRNPIIYHTCLNAARELEHLRDTGEEIILNKRTA